MRISDWSSDVCSSDLVLFGEATSVGAVDRPTADFLILAVAISMVLTPISVALAARLRRVFDRSPVAEAPLPDIEEQEARVVIAGFGRFGQIRSEEHTSELQSLMRISYAVFCLKKKKPDIQQPTTDTTCRSYPTQKPHNKNL